MERAGATTTLNKRQDDALMSGTALNLSAFLLADEGFIDLNDRTWAAHRGQIARAQRFTYAMTHKPRAFQRNS